MDSPTYQPSPNLGRTRTHSSLSARSTAYPLGIRKHSSPRARAISVSQIERLEQLVFDQSSTSSPDFQPIPQAPLNPQWLTPQHSPQPELFPETVSIEPFAQWNVPTPPRSDSGVPTLSIDSSEEQSNSDTGSLQPFDFGPMTTSAEMDSLGFLLPQYGPDPYSSNPSNYPMDQTYPPIRSPPMTSGGPSHGQTIPSSPALYQSRSSQSSTANRRHGEFISSTSVDSSYNPTYRTISNPYGSPPGSEFRLPPSQTIPSISGLVQSPLPSPHLGAATTANSVPQYNTGTSRSSGSYDSSIYSQAPSNSSGQSSLYSSGHSMSYPTPLVGSNGREPISTSSGSDSSSKLLNHGRPKPQCWDHGCNGRQFSTFSNLLRHQREKSGTASKSYCPRCGAEFTRSTARNGHLAHDKCTKNRQSSEDRPTQPC